MPLIERSLILVAVLCSARTASADDGTSLVYGAATRDAQVLAPELAAGRARADVAAAGTGVARIFQNPVGVVGSTTDGPKFFSTLTIPLPITRRSNAIRAAEASAATAAAEVPLIRLDAALGASNAWCDLWLAERSLEVAQENAARAHKILVATEQRLKDGSGPRLDVARAKAEDARTRAEALARVDLVADASAQLAYWLGRDPAVVLHVTGTPPDAANLRPLNELVGRLDSHPIAMRSAARSRSAVAAVDVQKGQRWPSFGLQLGATLADANSPANNFQAGIAFDLPVFNWNKPAVVQAETGVVQASAEAKTELGRLRATFSSAHAVLRAAIVRADAAEKEVRPAAQAAADLTRDAYDAGAVDLTAVLAAEKVLADAKQASYDAIAQRGRAVAALEHALGGPL